MAQIELVMGQRVYISGPIKGYELNERKEEFACKQRELIMRGLLAVNPFKNGLPDYAPDEEHLRADLKLLLGCDAILMLRGWEKSVGARFELLVASQCGIRILFDKYDQLTVLDGDDDD